VNDPDPAEDALDEKHLVARVLARDAEAERAFYEAHVDRVYRLAYRMAGDEALAEDFTQDTFLRAFDRLPGFRGEARLSTWIHSIAVSVILNGLRRVKRRRDRETCVEHPDALGHRNPGPGPETRIGLTRAIDGLTDKLRVVLLMHDLEGYTHEEIAGALGIPVGTSKARLSRAHDKMRRALAAC